MKCSSCLIEVNENIKEHYLTDLHSENTRRKIQGIPPASSLEEIQNETIALQNYVASDIFKNNIDKKNQKKEKNQNLEDLKVIGEFECFLCDVMFENQENLFLHLMDHGIEIGDFIQIRDLLEMKKCVFCCQIIASKSALKNHMLKIHAASENKIKNQYQAKPANIETDGTFGYLENGKIIGNKENLNCFKQNKNILISRNEEKGQIEVHKLSKSEINQLRKIRKHENKYSLKVSLGMNHQLHFTEHWMQ